MVANTADEGSVGRATRIGLGRHLMSTKLRIVSANVRGLNSNRKKKRLLKELKQRKIDICIVSDTRIGEEDINILKQDQEFDCVYTEKQNTIIPSRGVLIIWKKKSLINIETLSDRTDGNLLISKVTYADHTILLCGLYGPNEDSPEFFEYLEAKLAYHTESNVIVCGDFNVTQNHEIDNENYANERNRRARTKIHELMNNQELVDIYRDLNGDIRRYTWFSDGGNQRARLDYFLISSGMKSKIEKCEISVPMCNSDHRSVELEIDFDKFQRGKGLWKLQDYLLKDIQYVDMVNKSIDETLVRHMANEEGEQMFPHNRVNGYYEYWSKSPEEKTHPRGMANS